MSIRTRRAHRHAKTHIIGFGVAGIFGFIALFTIALFFSLGAIVDSWLQDLPDFNSADAYLVAEPTHIYDKDGAVLADYYTQNRIVVEKDQISSYVLKGTVDTEDVRFFQHNGVDAMGIIRATVVQALGGSEGASTITQQLVRNTVLSDEQFEVSLKRKVREAYIALKMEKRYNKEQILAMYLNTIYYGSGAYGIEAASKTYFNKSAKDLTLAEASLLVGLPNGPGIYDPTKNPDLAVKRRNIVLSRMLAAGDITQEEYDETIKAPLELNLGSTDLNSIGNYPYWSAYIRNLLAEDFSSDTILKGGLKVYTTLDKKAQDAAQEAVNNQLEKIGEDGLQSALVAMEPTTGYIRAMVGGTDFSKNQVNLATQGKRQVGSTFKLFTLTAAINEGMSPQTYINCSSPLQVNPTWKVRNYGGASYGTITMKYATALSSNTGFVQIGEAIGVDKVRSMAKNMGVKEEIPPYDSILLGSAEVPVIQMAEAYNTINAGGVHRDAVAITRIEDRNGNVVYDHNDEYKQVVSSQVAGAVRDVLEGVVNNSTARVVKNYDINQPIAGKTGTTQYVDNLWFCGFTPQITVAVWTGYPNSNQSIYVNGGDGHPYNTSCPIWGAFVESYLAGQERQEFVDVDEPEYKPNSSWTFIAGNRNSSYSYSDDDDDDDEPDETENGTGNDAQTNNTTTAGGDQDQGAAQTPEAPAAGGGDGGGGEQ